MNIEPTNETARRNNNQGWTPPGPHGPISKKLMSQAVHIKELAQRAKDRDVCESLIMVANNILDETGRVEALETGMPVGR